MNFFYLQLTANCQKDKFNITEKKWMEILEIEEGNSYIINEIFLLIIIHVIIYIVQKIYFMHPTRNLQLIAFLIMF